MRCAVVIFCDDFRLFDNPALFHACQKYERIIPIFVYDECYLGRNIGGASKVFLHHVLESFIDLLSEKHGVKLIIRKGDLVNNLQSIFDEIKYDAIYFNRSYSRKQIDQEKEINSKFKHLEIRSFKGKVLFDRGEIRNKSGSFFKVFTPFAKCCFENRHLIGDCFPMPEKINGINKITSLSLLDLELLPKNQGKWDQKIMKHWQIDYKKIEDNLNNFIQNSLASYHESRNFPGLPGTSNISPYLRFGILSPKLCFNLAVRFSYGKQFCYEILWRDFAYQALFLYPDMSVVEVDRKYSGFRWENNQSFFKKWKTAQTGFEIVDAGMNQLWESGVMHGRVRMISASFLIKNLLVDWRLGEQWFWDLLVDADPAINPFSWQWVFGSGFDAAPYFRVFNSEIQSKKFDPEQLYTKLWRKDDSKNKITNLSYSAKEAIKRYKELINKVNTDLFDLSSD